MRTVARKLPTVIQADSMYMETWAADPGDPWPDGATAYVEFLDSYGALIGDALNAESVDSRYITFKNQYADVASVPNGAGYRVTCVDGDGPHVVVYGTVFRRQNFFPNSPTNPAPEAEPKRFTDTFQRPAGALGGRWKTLVGQPRIFDNSGSLPNSVGPNHNFFSRYYTRFYEPFNGDSVDLSISVLDKGAGTTIVTVCGNSDGTQSLYVDFKNDDSVGMGIAHGPDIGSVLSPSDALEPKITRATGITIPTDSVRNFKLRYDEATKEFALYNDDYTSKYQSWIDEDDEAPHGKGYRYFGIGGNASLLNSGVQVSYISAANTV